MADNYIFDKKEVSTKYGGLVKLLLFLSFIWVSIYSATTAISSGFYWNFGNMLDSSSQNFSMILIMILSEALIYWIAFEIIFYVYRYLLQFKIYSFIVPPERLKIESRVFYIYRNIAYGVFVNLCFLLPYLNIFAPFVSLLITFITLLLYSYHLNKTYAEPIIGHFVFKNFCFPVFVYQAILLFVQVIEVL